MNNKINLWIFLIMLFSLSSLACLQMPVYLNWRSFDGFSYYDFQTVNSYKHQQVYKVNSGIDTLFSNGIRVRIELTNQEKQLFSQVVIDHAQINYNFKNGMVECSIKDYGYGNGFLLFNRRNDNVLWGKNALFLYRWQGLQGYLSSGTSRWGLGIGSNTINYVLSEVNYRLLQNTTELNVFSNYVLKDNHYSTEQYQFGSETRFKLDIMQLHSAFVYGFMPKSKHHNQMNSWHWINEIDLSLPNKLALILSAELKTTPEDKSPDNVYELCFDTSYKRLQTYFGVREQSIARESNYIYFTDFNFKPLDDLLLGIFFDYTDLTGNEDYFRFGFQTRYAFQ